MISVGLMIVSAVVLVVPFWFLLPRAGIRAPFALVAVVPLGAVALLWVLAFKRWPVSKISRRF